MKMKTLSEKIEVMQACERGEKILSRASMPDFETRRKWEEIKNPV